MSRGQPPKVTENRILLEILLQPDRAVFSGEIADNVDVSRERVRQLLRGLSDNGLVEITDAGNQNVYRLTDDGYAQLADVLRAKIS
jgi:DNA-binding IscR family transcriptional regulator